MPKTKPAAEPEPTPRKTTYTAALFIDDDAEDFELTAEQYAAVKAHLKTLTEKPDPNDHQAFHAKRLEERDRLNRDAKYLSDLFGDLNGFDLADLETVRLIRSRWGGCSTPLEEFYVGLLHSYRYADDEGRGVMIAEIESRFDDLKEALPDAIKEAHLVARQYPLPKADAEARS